jgi:hypothetical protein
MAIKLFELGFVLKAVDCLSGTLKKIETQMEAVNATSAAPLREFGGNLAMADGAITAGAIAFPLKDAIEKADEFDEHMARLATAIRNAPDKARQLGEEGKFASEQSIATGYDVNQLTESLRQGLSGFLNMTQAMAVSVDAAKLVRGTTGDLTGTTLQAALPAGGLGGETAGEGFLKIMTQMSRASKRLEVFAGPNAQGIHLLKTLQGIQRQFADISNHQDIAAAIEKAFGARAVFIGAVLAAVIGAIRLGCATLIPHTFEWGVNRLKTPAERLLARSEQASLRAALTTFAKGIPNGVMWPVHAIERVVTRMRSYLTLRPARVGPLRDLNRVRIVETIAQAIAPAPMHAAIRRVAAAAALTMPMMIAGAAMPFSLDIRAAKAAPAAIASSPTAAGAVVLNYAPHVEVHAPGGDAATLEKTVMEALEKNRREVYRMLEQVAGRRDRMRFGG